MLDPEGVLINDVEYSVEGSGLLGLGFGVQDGEGVECVGIRVWGSGFGVQDGEGVQCWSQKHVCEESFSKRKGKRQRARRRRCGEWHGMMIVCMRVCERLPRCCKDRS